MSPVLHGTQIRARTCACPECVAAVETRAALLDYFNHHPLTAGFTRKETP